MLRADIKSLDFQAEFLAQCIEAWLEATGRKEDVASSQTLDPDNVAYQGRVVVSFLALLPACIWKLRKAKAKLVSEKAKSLLIRWLREVMERAGLLKNHRFLGRHEFKEKGYLGSGGLARFRDTLWAAAIGSSPIKRLKPDQLVDLASKHLARVRSELAKGL
jgi:hypothetical protein